MRTYLLPLLLLPIINCTTEPAAEHGTQLSSGDGKADGNGPPTVWFGQNEVSYGRLQSPDPSALVAGGNATLELFLGQLSNFMYDSYVAPLGPHLFVRYDGSSAFQEITGIPAGYLDSAGGATWDAGNEFGYHYDVTLAIPSSADRIEAYIYWDRMSFTCVLESEETCTVNGPADGKYLSNFGRNFRIDVH